MATGLFDLDYIKYTASCVGETTSILVVNDNHYIEEEFSNKTEFWGSKRSRDGGWLHRYNEREGADLVWSDFEIREIKKPSPLANVLHTCNRMVEKAVKSAKLDSVKFYIGGKSTYREDLSTLKKYKGNRDDLIKPYHLEDVAKYLSKRFKAEEVNGIECDDKLVMEAYKRPDRVILGVDKDYYGQPVKYFNLNKPKEGVIDCRGLGKLWTEGKGKNIKFRGYGSLFLYWQMCSEDDIDNYKANCKSGIRWGARSAHDALVDCKTQKEAWEAMVGVFKKLYPSKIEVKSWRGDKIEIDWLYVLQEMMNMAKMLRFKGDVTDVRDVLDKFKIKY